MKISLIKTSIGIFLLVACWTYTSCVQDKDMSPVPIKAFDFKNAGTEPLSFLLDTGEVKPIVVILKPDSVLTEPVLWKSENPKVAIVQNNERGIVAGIMGVGPGTTRIVASTLNNSIQKEIPVRVIYKVHRIKFDTLINRLAPDSFHLNILYKPSEPTVKDLIWTSSNPAVATINNGLAVALAPGNTKITATTVEGAKTATTQLFVNTKTGVPAFGKEYCTIVGYGNYNPDIITTTGAVQNLNYQNTSIPPNNYAHVENEKLIVKRGTSFTINLTQSNNWSRSMIFIDWNSDANFENPKELMALFGSFSKTNDGPFTTTITVPGDAVTGKSRVRIITGDAWTFDIDQDNIVRNPCDYIADGTILDFDLQIN